MNKRVLISLHDVTAFHLERIRKAERLFRRWGAAKISYLFIPDYHGQNRQADQGLLSAFCGWVREKQAAQGRDPLQIEWILHGYFHREIEREPAGSKSRKRMSLQPSTDVKPPARRAIKSFGKSRNPFSKGFLAAGGNNNIAPALTFAHRLKRRFLTAGEGEFLTLSPAEIDERLREGTAIFHDYFFCSPGVFVAPAWLFGCHLLPVLKKHRFRITEDHSFIYLLEKDKVLPVPVITWATRTLLRRFTSRTGCPLLNRFWSGRDLVRVAMHPFDFDHPPVIKSIEKVIAGVLSKREAIHYRELE